MPVIPLECPSCGTDLRIESDESAAICKHCGKPFVVKDAIVLNYIKIVTAENEKALVLNEFEIEEGVLKKYNGLSSVVEIPDHVIVIGSKAFEDLREIKEVHLSESVEEIEDNAFSGCDNLKTVYLTESLKKIGSYAFSECSSLEAVDLPSSIEEIGAYCFGRCFMLTSVRMPPFGSNIHETAFMGDKDIVFDWPEDWANKQIDKLRIVAPSQGGMIELFDRAGDNDTFLYMGISDLGMYMESTKYYFYSYKDFMRQFSIEKNNNDPYLLRTCVDNAQLRYNAVSDIQKSYSELIGLLDLAKIKRSVVETINIPHFIWKQGKGLSYKVVDIGSVPVLQVRLIQE